MNAPTPFTTLELSVGPVPVFLKDAYALDLLGRLQLEVLGHRRELDAHQNNALLRDACPILMPLTALMLAILAHPAPESPIVEVPGEIVQATVPPEFEPVTIGDLCAIIGVTQAMRGPLLPSLRLHLATAAGHV